MLSRVARSAVKSARTVSPLAVSARTRTSSIRSLINSTTTKRFQSKLSQTPPEEVFTKLTDENDPQREAIFQYTWGTWLQNDAKEKAKRKTVFSIQGLNEVVDKLISSKEEAGFKALTSLEDGKVKGITQNLSLIQSGEGSFDNVSQIVSIHEGKHNRIYQIKVKYSDSKEKEFVLRLPYKLIDSELFLKRKIESEVATLDFADLKLKMDVPKVIAYSGTADNSLKSPFILMEYKSGDLLMKDWNPLVPGEINDVESKASLLKVIQPLGDLNEKLISVEFNKFGSLYFQESGKHAQEGEVYVGESNDGDLKGRWYVGPTTERQYYKNKEGVSDEDIIALTGPWDKSEPLKMVDDLIKLEIKSLEVKLSSDGITEEDKIIYNKSIKTYKDLQTIVPMIFNLSEGSGIPHLDRLLKANLFHPDLDPMNVIKSTDGNYLIDFESTSIKPYLLFSTPNFVNYTGPKIFELSKEIENYENLDELEKQQYEFMFFKTRNQFYWDLMNNEKDKKLMGSIGIKLLKYPYLSILQNGDKRDYMYIQNGLNDIIEIWDNYKSINLIDSNLECPLKLPQDENEINEFINEFGEYQLDISSKPFYATKGWIPQDMFNNLQRQGLINELSNGDYEINTGKLTEEPVPEQA